MSKETFKNFIKTKPELIDYVNNGTMTWQKFYELYDLYGEDSTVWNEYTTKKSKIPNILDKFDPDKVKEQLDSVGKALDIFSELATKSSDKITTAVKPTIERPLSKFFGD